MSFEEGENSNSGAEYTSVSVTIKDSEQLIYKQYKEDVTLLKGNKISFLFKHLNEGDSAFFKVSIDRISKELKPLSFRKFNSDFVDVTIKIHKHYTKAEYADINNGDDKEMMEQLLLNKYLEDVKAENQNGIYKEVLNRGLGEVVKKGDKIKVAYKGYFINRLEFDQVSGATAFTFKYGTPGQVIKGLDIAIKSMREGEKSKIIIPSQLAFGEEGSTTLVVPSFTTVIYELEILKIN